ncbi:uncharacterized protein B0P05DRAFT_467946 [Gilbertella persicaria]|uniref:uncharacterized protein n=1 Tax=Gilbertella persicaria TaxID=101096 RepID=UPI00221FFCA0|nr:uncharacterized protein B0P05DRAFT_467946 [Gilbertella persicaria]KAI8082532.1 hypothetical protein B0P05DRAFT_467946 [Gilbertella persicaria]
MLATQVVVQFIGKTNRLWPQGLAGGRVTNSFHEKTLHEQKIILQSFPNNPKQEGTLLPGTHRWPFQFLLSSQLVETIEDQMGQVFYYVTATVHRVGVGATKLRSRCDILLLRTPHGSDTADNSLPTTSVTSERKMDICDTNICIEKSSVAGGTQLPISLTISPNTKHVYIESMTVILHEKKIYRLPETQARRSEVYDYKVALYSVHSAADPDLRSSGPSLKPQDIKRAFNIKNAHISLNEGPFQYRLIFSLPDCFRLNHSTTYHEIDIRHTLKIHIELSSPVPHSTDAVRTDICLETPITILDCRLKDDYNKLPSYEEAVLYDTSVDQEDVSKSTGFLFVLVIWNTKRSGTVLVVIGSNLEQNNDSLHWPPQARLFLLLLLMNQLTKNNCK